MSRQSKYFKALEDDYNLLLKTICQQTKSSLINADKILLGMITAFVREANIILSDAATAGDLGSIKTQRDWDQPAAAIGSLHQGNFTDSCEQAEQRFSHALTYLFYLRHFANNDEKYSSENRHVYKNKSFLSAINALFLQNKPEQFMKVCLLLQQKLNQPVASNRVAPYLQVSQAHENKTSPPRDPNDSRELWRQLMVSVTLAMREIIWGQLTGRQANDNFYSNPTPIIHSGNNAKIIAGEATRLAQFIDMMNRPAVSIPQQGPTEFSLTRFLKQGDQYSGDKLSEVLDVLIYGIKHWQQVIDEHKPKTLLASDTFTSVKSVGQYIVSLCKDYGMQDRDWLLTAEYQLLIIVATCCRVIRRCGEEGIHEFQVRHYVTDLVGCLLNRFAVSKALQNMSFSPYFSDKGYQSTKLRSQVLSQQTETLSNCVRFLVLPEDKGGCNKSGYRNYLTDEAKATLSEAVTQLSMRQRPRFGLWGYRLEPCLTAGTREDCRDYLKTDKTVAASESDALLQQQADHNQYYDEDSFQGGYGTP